MGNSFALFVDAGYLYAGVGRLIAGKTVKRHEVVVDHCPLVERLTSEAAQLALQEFRLPATAATVALDPLRFLRCYWYDGAPDFIPSDDQRRIGALTNVKVRLGKLTKDGQKGVDGLIILDLITLAQDRAMDTAFLLSGDEDLREAVGRAQTAGVRVTLLGIPGTKQASTLIAEADRHVILSEELWRGHVGLNSGAHGHMSQGSAHEPSSQTVSDHEGTLAGIVRMVLDGWLNVAQQPEIAQTLASKPKVPVELDKQLLRKAAAVLGERVIPDKTRESLRVEFWTQLANRDG